MGEKKSFEQAFRQLAEAQEKQLGSHIDPQELADYHDNILSEKRMAQIQEHLVLCQFCTNELFQYSPEEYLDTPQKDEASESDLSSLSNLNTYTEQRKKKWRTPALLSIAACLILTVALAIQVLQIRNLSTQNQLLQDSARRQKPLLSSLIHLEPDDRLTRAEDSGKNIISTKANQPITLILNSIHTGNHPTYQVEIKKEDLGETMWIETIENSSNIVLFYPPNFLPEGNYSILLKGVKDGIDSILEEYHFVVQ